MILMKPKQLKAGVIGFGKMGILHSAIINVLPKVKLSAISETNKIILDGLDHFLPNIRLYKDYKEMLRQENLDVVFITTPSFSHVEIALDCLKYDCHLFIEKPLSIDVNSAKQLVKAFEKHDLITMVGYMMRYIDSFELAKRIIDKKALGRIIFFKATSYVSQLFKAGKGWRYDPKKSGGGVVMTQGVHALDLINWYFGMPLKVCGQISSYYSRKVEDFGHASFVWKNGISGWLDCSWSVDNYRLLEVGLQITGTNGSLYVNQDVIKLYLHKKAGLYDKGWTIKTRPELYTNVKVDIGGNQYTKQDSDFVKSVIYDKQPRNNLITAFEVQKIVKAIYKSAAKDGREILIK